MEPIEVLLGDAAWLRRLTIHLARDADGAAELEQDVAIAALQAGGLPVGRAWFVAVARRLWALRLRRRRREIRRLAGLEPGDSSPGAADVVADAELQRRAVDAVLALPPHYRDTILLRFLRGLSVEATAQRLDVGIDTVRTRQKRALRRLRLELLPDRERSARLGSSLGGILMGMNKVSVTVAAVALLVALCGWLVRTDPVAAPAGPETAPLATVGALPASPQDGSAVPSPVEVGEATRTRRVVEDADTPPERVPPRRAPAVPTGSILVTVVDVEERPAGEGHAILCRSSSGPGQVLVSDAASLVHFRDLPVGRYSLATGDLRRRHPAVEVAAGTTATVTMRVWSPARIAGRVVDVDGRPVPFASIEVRHGGWPSWPFPVGRADAGGRFEVAAGEPFQILFATDPSLGVTPGRLLQNADLAADPPAEIELRFTDREVFAVRGRVLDGSGTPVSHAWVQLNPASGTSSARRHAAAQIRLCTTDVDGRFAAGGIPPGRCRLYVAAKGLASHTRELQVTPEPIEVEVVLTAGATVRGIVRDDRGRPVAGASVQAEGRSFPKSHHQTSDADGRFVVEDVAVGICRISAWQKQSARVHRDVEIAGPGEHEIEIVLTEGDCIRGRLLDALGRPLAHWMVERTGGGRWTTTGADGRFVCVECLQEGNELRVRPSGKPQPVHAVFAALRASPDEQVLIVPDERMPNAKVRGQVLDGLGRAVAGAQLQLGQADRSWVLPARTPADGTFEIGPLPPGKYVLQPLHDGLTWAAVPFELRPYEELQLTPASARR